MSDLEWSVQNVRNSFVDFFEKKYEHKNVVSSPVVPLDDPTLLFTNAGMNQFKPIFVDTIAPTDPLYSVKRAVNTQKCIRAGGKHNDLDDVGKDTYHHTFFEMLGNWSFGDYFKAEAIEWAWELLTEVWKLPKDRLYATYFGGDEESGLPVDEEARELWLARGLPPERVLPFGMKDNFWEMGATGPCGPCSELHFDRIGGRDAASLVNMDDPNVIEIWNLVFMQFNRAPDGSLSKLPAQHVDTGAGLERVCSILQNKSSNYDTDIFAPLFARIQEVTGAPAYTGLLGKEDAAAGHRDMAYRVVADHARTLSFALIDGATPGPEGRGYVLRRIVRRAVRYGSQCLGSARGFFSKVLPTVAECMGDAFPELRNEQAFARVVSIVAREEALFERTLEKGTKRMEKEIASLPADGPGRALSGATAWDLYSTYGFPLDLTQLMADEANVQVDTQGYEEARKAFVLESQKGASSVSLGLALDVFAIDHLKKEDVAPTDDSPKYEVDPSTDEVLPVAGAKVQAIYAGADAFVAHAGDERAQSAKVVGLVLDRTNFYAEQGGQVGDTGFITVEGEGGDQVRFEVADSQVAGGYVLHIGRLAAGCTAAQAAALKVGASVRCEVRAARRRDITSNHTLTHVVNWSLRRALNDSAVSQRGSKVDARELRFDFSWDRGLTQDELRRVDEASADVIAQNQAVFWKEVPLEQAKAINGLVAVFGEKYPDPVRVVAVGVSVDDLLANPGSDWGAKHSVEFCGGTHLGHTGDARCFATLSENALAQGVRRLVAVTGERAEQAHSLADELDARAAKLATASAQAAKGSSQTENARLGEERLQLKKDVDKAEIPYWRKMAIRVVLDKLAADAAALTGDRKKLEKAAGQALQEQVLASDPKPRFFVAEFKEANGNTAVLTAVNGELAKAGIPSCLVSADLLGKKPKVVVVAAAPSKDGPIAADAWVKHAAAVGGGRGGGRPDKAAANHTAMDKIAETVAAAKEFAEKALA